MSPQVQSVALWIMSLAINITAVCAGIVWGWEVFTQFLLPAFGAVVGASMVSYSLRR
ncbi:hypothetical protein QNO09_31710 [Streptomyces sp. 378]|uniref:hypothetical protein n=1 Tax=Streptomyces sp. 378 TaxID=3049412 RepID=UPI0024C2DD9F|nr:hypothetical protein [Streptomyces sp. 378]MDK1347771.1 hypothetical protein [Streptomyces sp. 378]